MSRHTLGRKVRDREEARVLLPRWKASGLSFAAWCEQHGINVHSLTAHKRFLEEGEPCTDDSPFVELTLPAAPPQPAAYEIALPNGLALRVHDGFTPAAVQQLLALIAAC